MKKTYTIPTLGLSIFSADDIITTSAAAFADEVITKIKKGGSPLTLDGQNTLSADMNITYIDMGI